MEVARETDTAAILRFQRQDPEADWSGRPQLYVARLGGRVVGWAWIDERGADDELFPGVSIWTLGVRTPFRGMGLGAALVGAAIERAQAGGHERVSVVVRAGNDPAVALYQKLGFDRHRTPALDAYLERRRALGVDSIVFVRWL